MAGFSMSGQALRSQDGEAELFHNYPMPWQTVPGEGASLWNLHSSLLWLASVRPNMSWRNRKESFIHLTTSGLFSGRQLVGVLAKGSVLPSSVAGLHWARQYLESQVGESVHPSSMADLCRAGWSLVGHVLECALFYHSWPPNA